MGLSTEKIGLIIALCGGVLLFIMLVIYFKYCRRNYDDSTIRPSNSQTCPCCDESNDRCITFCDDNICYFCSLRSFLASPHRWKYIINGATGINQNNVGLPKISEHDGDWDSDYDVNEISDRGFENKNRDRKLYLQKSRRKKSPSKNNKIDLSDENSNYTNDIMSTTRPLKNWQKDRSFDSDEGNDIENVVSAIHANPEQSL